MNLNLHLRVLIGYHALVGFLVLSAVGAALGFHQVGDSLSQGVAATTRNVQSTSTVLAQLDRQDALLRQAVRGDMTARVAVQKGWADLESKISFAVVPEQVDPAAVQRDVRLTLARYRQLSEDLLATLELRGTPEVAPLDAYEDQVGESFRALKVQVYQLLEEDLRTTVEREVGVESAARRYAAIYAALLVLALIVVAFLSRQLRRGLVDRLVATATVAQAVADGDRTRRVNSGPDDELGIIGRQLNALLDTEQSLHAQMDGRLCQQRQLLLGILHLWPKKVSLFTIYGDLAVCTLDEPDREEIAAAELHFPDPPAQSRDDKAFAPQLGKRELHCRLLRVDGRRPVGWLCELD